MLKRKWRRERVGLWEIGLRCPSLSCNQLESLNPAVVSCTWNPLWNAVLFHQLVLWGSVIQKLPGVLGESPKSSQTRCLGFSGWERSWKRPVCVNEELDMLHVCDILKSLLQFPSQNRWCIVFHVSWPPYPSLQVRVVYQLPGSSGDDWMEKESLG